MIYRIWKNELNFIAVLIAVLFVASISGCGFHLKGLQNKTPVSIYLDYGQVSASFRQEFKQVLSENAFVVQPSHIADVRVEFLKEHWQRQSLSVADDGRAAEYRLRYVLSYSFRKHGVEKFDEISESRDFKSNNAQLLAVESEQSILKQRIQQSAAERVLRFVN